MKVCIVRYQTENTCSVINELNDLSTEQIQMQNPIKLQSINKNTFVGTIIKNLIRHGLDKITGNFKKLMQDIYIYQQLIDRYFDERVSCFFSIYSINAQYFPIKTNTLKVAEIGWNDVQNIQMNLAKGLSDKSDNSFLNDNYVSMYKPTIETLEYITPFYVVIHQSRFQRTQYYSKKNNNVEARISRN